MNANAAEPLISVIMANHNGAPHIAEAVRSVLAQTERSLELIISDDGSSDDSLSIAAEFGGGDPRLVILAHVHKTGPAAARNRALAAARGKWVAIVDNDDTIAPERLARLVAAAEADGADITADNLMTFHDDESRPPHPHLPHVQAAFWVDPAAYARSNIVRAEGAQLGYLKPIFRRERLSGARYDETLLIGEDSDLVQRLLIAGARMRVYPECGYRYRKRSGSISHRLSERTIDPMIAALQRLDAGGDPALRNALARQVHALRDARAFAQMVAALKTGALGEAFKIAARRPSALILLRDPISARISRWLRGGL